MRTFRNESAFNRWISDLLRAAGAHVFALVGSEMQAAGAPDRFVAHRKWRGWVEGKRDRGKLSDLQRIVARQYVERGVPVLVCRHDTVGCVQLESPADDLILSRHGLDDLERMTPRAAGHELLDALARAGDLVLPMWARRTRLVALEGRARGAVVGRATPRGEEWEMGGVEPLTRQTVENLLAGTEIFEIHERPA